MARVSKGTRYIYISVVSVVLSSVQRSQYNSLMCLLAILSSPIKTYLWIVPKYSCSAGLASSATSARSNRSGSSQCALDYHKYKGSRGSMKSRLTKWLAPRRQMLEMLRMRWPFFVASSISFLRHHAVQGICHTARSHHIWRSGMDLQSSPPGQIVPPKYRGTLECTWA